MLRGIASHLPEGATVDEIETLAVDFVERPEVVRLIQSDTTVGLTGTDIVRRIDGSIVAAPIAGSRWSTAELIDIEQRLVGAAIGRVGDGSGLVDGTILARVLVQRPTLSDEQVEMVSWLVRDGNGVQIVCAAAGTGKTYTLDAAREAWELAGYRVIGAAMAGRAAQELQSSAGIASSTLAMLNIDLAAGRVRFDYRTALVIDEASMAGTRTLAPILDAGHQAGALVVLVGDPAQLPEIDAGGVLNALACRLDTIELIENRRQRADWEKDALSHLRNGNPDNALGAYERNRREIVVDDRPFQAGDNIICLRNERRLGVCNGTRAVITKVDSHGRTVTVEAPTGASCCRPSTSTPATSRTATP